MAKRNDKMSLGAFLLFTGHHVAAWRHPSASDSDTLADFASFARIAEDAKFDAVFVGTSKTIADEMERWLVERGSDRFNVMFPYLPEGLDDFVDKVMPELQRRGIFRKDYAGPTLRENLGLRRPANRFFAG